MSLPAAGRFRVLKKQLVNSTKSIRFRRWTRKSYAIFAGLNKVISIGKIKAGICDRTSLKTNSLSVIDAIFVSNLLKTFDENEETEELLFENFLQANLQALTMDVPVYGLKQYYIRNLKLE